MKFAWSRKKAIQLASLLLILAVAPFFIEIAFLADIAGAEFAISFLILLLRNHGTALKHRLQLLGSDIAQAIRLLAQSRMFHPRLYLSHAGLSILCITLTGSALLSSMLWLPAIVASSMGMGPWS